MTYKTVFAGFGGQGVLVMGYLLALTAMRQGKEVTYLPAYGAEVRGGTANCTVVVSDQEIASPVASSPDCAVIMNNPSLARFVNVVRPGGLILVNSSLVQAPVRRDDLTVVSLPVNALAHELGNDRAANVIMVGALLEASGVITLAAASEVLAETGLGKKPKILELNRRALALGANEARLALHKEKSA
jgi:2-oxoglutarate ferredoxin oxidoreductase subunit gamma